MFVIGIILRGLALLLMWYISNPKIMKLSPPEDQIGAQNTPTQGGNKSTSEDKKLTEIRV